MRSVRPWGVALLAALGWPALFTGTAIGMEPPPAVYVDAASGQLNYRGNGAREIVTLTRSPSGRVVVMAIAPQQVVAGAGCVRVAHPTIQKFDCGPASPRVPVYVTMAGGSDTIEWRLPVSGVINGGRGYDTFRPAPGIAGTGERSGVTVINSDDGRIDYSSAGVGVVVSSDGIANDGRPGDSDNIRVVGWIIGTSFDDVLVGDSTSSEGTVWYGPGEGRDLVRTNKSWSLLEGDKDNEVDTIDCGYGDNKRGMLEPQGSLDDIDVLIDCNIFN